jgi:hypothetical protein
LPDFCGQSGKGCWIDPGKLPGMACHRHSLDAAAMTVILATMLTAIVMGEARGRQLPGEVMPVVRRPSNPLQPNKKKKPLQPNKKRNWLSVLCTIPQG